VDVARSRNRDGVNGEGFGVWLTRSGSRIVKFLTRIFVRSIASVMLESAAYLDGIVRPHADRGQQVAKTARKKLCRDGEVAEIVEHIRGDGRTCEEWSGIRSALEPRQRLLARTRYRRIVPKLRREGMAGEMDEPI